MSAPDAEPSDDWSDLSEDEIAELRRAFAEADENRRNGVGIPIDDVLPRYRRAG